MNELKVGDLLATLEGQWVPVEDVLDTGVYERVYNCRVADFHTYFVGCLEWGFAVWTHNLGGCDVWAAMGNKAEDFAALPEAQQVALNVIANHINLNQVKDARQALQGQGLSGTKAAELDRHLAEPARKRHACSCWSGDTSTTLTGRPTAGRRDRASLSGALAWRKCRENSTASR